MTHQEFIKFFLNIKKSQLAELTLISYEKCLKKYLPENELLENLDIFQAQEIMLNMEGLSKATQRRNLTILKEYYQYAVKYKKASENPFCDVEKPKYNKQSVLANSLSQEEIQKMLKAAKNLPVFWQAFFVLALDSGARRGELIALKWEDVDLKEQNIVIKHSAYCRGSIKIKETKGKKERIIHISKETTKLLKKLLLEQKKECLKKGTPLNDFIFTINEKLINPSSATHAWKRFVKHNNLNKHRLHDLRHTTATILLQNNVDVNTVRERLGHSQLSTTLLYIHSNEDITAATVISNIIQDITSC